MLSLQVNRQVVQNLTCTWTLYLDGRFLPVESDGQGDLFLQTTQRHHPVVADLGNLAIMGDMKDPVALGESAAHDQAGEPKLQQGTSGSGSQSFPLSMAGRVVSGIREAVLGAPAGQPPTWPLPPPTLNELGVNPLPITGPATTTSWSCQGSPPATNLSP